MTSGGVALESSANGASRQEDKDKESEPKGEHHGYDSPASAIAPRGPPVTISCTSPSLT